MKKEDIMYRTDGRAVVCHGMVRNRIEKSRGDYIVSDLYDDELGKVHVDEAKYSVKAVFKNPPLKKFSENVNMLNNEIERLKKVSGEISQLIKNKTEPKEVVGEYLDRGLKSAIEDVDEKNKALKENEGKVLKIQKEIKNNAAKKN